MQGNYGNLYRRVIEGRTFEICTEALYEEASTRLSGEWHAWCFFAHDKDMNVYPPNDVPDRISVQQSIVGETRDTEPAACDAVAQRLNQVIHSKKLDGTGFLSPPAGLIWPQEFPKEK